MPSPVFRRRRLSGLLACGLFTVCAAALGPLAPRRDASPRPPAFATVALQTQTGPPADPVERIKDEALNRSQAMQILGHLTEVIGPRLTNSPQMRRANEWTRDKLASWGLQNARLEAWGPFGRGWTLKRFSAQVVEPHAIPLIAYPKAWSPGTEGVLTADVVHLDAKDEAELQKFKGRLKGALVLTSQAREVKVGFDPVGRRQTEKELLGLADAPQAAPARRFRPTPEQRAAGVWAARKEQFCADEGAALLVEQSRAGDGGTGDAGTLFVQAANVLQPYYEYPFDRRRLWPWEGSAKLVPQIVVSAEQYNRLVRMIRHGARTRMAVELAVEFHDEDPMAHNTVAEIPGTDLKDEVVMFGAHLDSWHAATGATDNAAGVAAAIEAARVIQAQGLRPRRTIRIALWGGEEQGLRGSRSYVVQRLAAPGDGSIAALMDVIKEGVPPADLNPKPEYENFSVYFNLDTGTGRIRGVYLQGNEAARPIFRHWLAPFKEMGAATLSAANIDGSDNLPFDAVGLPSFQFIQDQIEYRTRTWHTNQDLYDRVLADDLRHNAAVLAAFVYQAAMRDERLPRKHNTKQ